MKTISKYTLGICSFQINEDERLIGGEKDFGELLAWAFCFCYRL